MISGQAALTPLQWVRGRITAVMCLATIFPPMARLLQWVRGRITAVMHVIAGDVLIHFLLQWVRGRITAVLWSCSGSLSALSDPSMVRRSDTPGYGLQRRPPPGPVPLFNGSAVG